MSNNPFGENNPFGDLPEANPYSAPSTKIDPYHSYPATNPVMIPGIILLVLASIFLLILIGSIPGQVIQLREVDMSTPEGAGQMIGGVGSLFAWFLMTVAIILGSICMIRMKSYSGAMTAAIAAMIPCCSPFFVLGIPFGIWALVVLIRPGVRDQFG